MKFTLDFKSDNYGKKQIDEPFGSSDINFSLKQKENGMGRDVSFSGDEIQFEFTEMRNHELKELLYYHSKFGFESVVHLIMEVDESNKYTCELDFATAETDGLTYFKCKGLQDGKLQIIKRRKSVKVDLLSDVDVDGNYIGRLIPDNILLLAKPVIQNSNWEQNAVFDKNLNATVGANATVFYQINPCINLIKSDVEDSLSFFDEYKSKKTSDFTESDFLAIKAKGSLSNISINIKDILIHLQTDVDNGGNGYVGFSLEVAYGATFSTSTKIVLLTQTLIENQTFDFSGSKSATIPFLSRGDGVWIYFREKIRQSTNVVIFGVNPRFECFTTISGVKIDITAESTAYNSISKTVRLVDVIQQVVRSVSGLQINAPRFEALGKFYDNRLFNGNFLRGITDKPFYISLEDIEKSLPEVRGDWEIGSDGKVFFGIEADYYMNSEVWFFNNTQFSEMNKTFNPKYMINEFGLKYKNYQSLKENEEPNSADTIHGESKFVFFNKSVENKKEVEIDWTRDAFLIESIRRKSLEITDGTANQDDDTIFCIDTINTVSDNSFLEVTQLEHSYDVSNNRLILRNDGTVNFVSLGIEDGSDFVIHTVDLNAGNYTVFSILNNVLELTRTSVGIISTAGNGNRLTKYTYILPTSLIPFTNYTNQGFTETSGLGSADSYSNRRYSIKRNIHNYWQSYLATANLYWKNSPLKNTWYKNNGDYTAKYEGVKLTEKADFIPENPILSPVLYNEMIFANVDFSDFITLQNLIRSQRGFLRTIDNEDKVIKIYPVNIEYSLLQKELKIKGEEKFEPISMTISTEFSYILINNETRVDVLKYEIANEKLYIFDENRFRLYNGIYWHEVSINGAIPSSVEILKEWLNLL